MVIEYVLIAGYSFEHLTDPVATAALVRRSYL